MKTAYYPASHINHKPTQTKEDHTTNKAFITVAEVAEILSISKSYAYKIVHRLNEELKAKGYLTIAGRINRNYFLEKTCYQPEARASDSLPKGAPIP